MSLDAYRQAQAASESPRETEYRLFAQVTRSLMAAEQSGKRDHTFFDALDWNRQMWSAFSSDCGAKGNQLPDTLRAQIISISIWVSKYSSEVARNKAPMDALIDVNRAIMEGLAMQPQTAEANEN